VTGLLLVDKPAGPTSFGVLRALRPLTGKKAGHAGTLDPFATGLLLVLVGRATRLATFLSGLDKRYRAVVQFGAESTTLDPEGEITETGATTDAESVRRAAAGLTGSLMQQVPLASAVRVGGERSYARMRRGEQEAPAPREVVIEQLDVVSFDEAAQRAVVDVHCSKGTYVRQIAADLGAAVSAGAYCAELRRTSVGPFRVEEAATPERILEQRQGPWMLSPRDALPHLPERVLDDEQLAGVLHGREIPGAEGDGPVRLVHGQELVAVAVPVTGGLRPTVVLAS
jgi:tRNA pseudouridine55 synthase